MARKVQLVGIIRVRDVASEMELAGRLADMAYGPRRLRSELPPCSRFRRANRPVFAPLELLEAELIDLYDSVTSKL